jgi:hypothetical protein
MVCAYCARAFEDSPRTCCQSGADVDMLLAKVAAADKACAVSEAMRAQMTVINSKGVREKCELVLAERDRFALALNTIANADNWSDNGDWVGPENHAREIARFALPAAKVIT